MKEEEEVEEYEEEEEDEEGLTPEELEQELIRNQNIMPCHFTKHGTGVYNFKNWAGGKIKNEYGRF